MLAALPDGMTPGAAREIPADAGVEGWLLSETRLGPGGPDGFVIGYSGHGEAALRRAAAAEGFRAALGSLTRFWGLAPPVPSRSTASPRLAR